MEEILAHIHSAGAPSLRQFQKDIDEIQKEEVARKIASSASPQKAKLRHEKAKSRHESPRKSFDDSAHQVMDGDPAVLQVISTSDGWSSDTYKMVMKKDHGRLFFFSHDHEVNGELSGPESLIKFAIYDLKCKKETFSVAFIETKISTRLKVAGTRRSFVTLDPPNFEWRDTQIVRIKPALRGFEFEITVTIHRIPEPMLHLPIITDAIQSILSKNHRTKIEPSPADLPDGLKALFRAFSVDNKVPVLAVSSEDVVRSDKAAQEQKEPGQSTLAAAENMEEGSVVLKIKEFERSLRLIKERPATIQSAVEPRSDATQKATSQSTHAAGGAEFDEHINRVDADKEVSLDMESAMKSEESQPSANVQSCSYGNGECFLAKFAQRKERTPPKFKEKRQSTPAADGAEIEKFTKVEEVVQAMEPKKRTKEKPSVNVQSESSELHGGSVGQRLKALKRTSLSKKLVEEQEWKGHSPDACGRTQTEKRITRAVQDEEVALDKEPTKKTKEKPSVIVQSEWSLLHGGSFGHRVKGLKRTPLSKRVVEEQEEKPTSTDAARGGETEKLITRAVQDEEVALNKEPKTEQSATAHPESSEARSGCFGQRLKRMPRSEKVSPGQEEKDRPTDASNDADPAYLEIGVVPYEDVALVEVPSGQFKTPEPSSEKVPLEKKEKRRSAHASRDADPAYLEIRIVPYEEVALDESPKKSAEPESNVAVHPASSKVRYGSFGQSLGGLKKKPSSKKATQTEEDKGHPALAAGGADLDYLEIRILPNEEVALDREPTKESIDPTPNVTVPSNPFAHLEPSFTQFEQEILNRLRRILDACERMPAKLNTGAHSPSMGQAATKENRDASTEKGAG